MTGTGRTGPDFFRFWLDRNRPLFEDPAGPLWQQAERVFEAWASFADGFAGARAARQGASPFDPAGWLRPEGGGGMADLLRWIEGPTLPGALGEHARMVQGTREWMAYLTAVEQMKAALAEGWLAAFCGFVETIAEEDRTARAEGTAPPDWDRMQAVWQAEAAAAMTVTYRGHGFLAAQRDLVRAETDLRRSLRRRIEDVAEELGLPTRAELDGLHESVHRLSRELRRLRAEGRSAGRQGSA